MISMMTRKPVDGVVYFIGGGSFVKVGWTGGEPSARLAQLQTGNPTLLRVVATVPGTQREERLLHKMLSRARTVGEWFAGDDPAVKKIVAFAEACDTREGYWERVAASLEARAKAALVAGFVSGPQLSLIANDGK